MSKKVEEYIHHGIEVSVYTEAKGKHTEFCLCYDCIRFLPETPYNCPIAEEIFALCKKHNIVLPVWECPTFIKSPERFSWQRH